MRALSIRQPYAELILRGIKTAEYRTRPTLILGQRFWIYAPLKKAEGSRQKAEGPLIWSRDLAGARPPAWMVELAGQVGLIAPEALAALPVGVIVGSAVIERVEQVPAAGPYRFAWHLGDVRRDADCRKPKGHPQPGWFEAGV
jgi:predicted transcriptional regulator